MTDVERWGRATLVALVINGVMMAVAAWMAVAPRSDANEEYLPVDLITFTPAPEEEPPTPPPPHAPRPKPAAVPPPKAIIAPPEPVAEPEEPTVGLNEALPEAPPEKPQPAPEPAYRPAGEVNHPPSFLRRSSPVYPEKERRRGEESFVLAELFISRAGEVDKVVIIESGGERFDKAVLAAIGKSRFRPGAIDGRPVGVRVRIPFRFRLR